MMTYFIKEKALKNYNQIFQNKIKSIIFEMINENFIYDNNYQKISLTFYNDYIIGIVIQGEEISDLVQLSYDFFISNELLDKISTLSNLPPRLDRIRLLGKDKIREEIKEALRLGRIKLKNRSKFVYWEKYEIKLIMKDGLRLFDLIV
ncbi:hypothetical protein NQ126_009855 [Priestia megaterium]|uniref:hypothetical protein n=1 Tax=Priestia megaterium TaxID=1404 RepID=UPI0024467859|nr:hypothetical protein [Priestia megaterium]WRQ94726.1 hypothetical protein NQ126_009855 [Priestia megaterium]